MPYKAYSKMDKEDVYAIIAYLRQLPPIPHTVPERELHFPVNFLVNTFPSEASTGKRPRKKNSFTIRRISCTDCRMYRLSYTG